MHTSKNHVCLLRTKTTTYDTYGSVYTFTQLVKVKVICYLEIFRVFFLHYCTHCLYLFWFWFCLFCFIFLWNDYFKSLIASLEAIQWMTWIISGRTLKETFFIYKIHRISFFSPKCRCWRWFEFCYLSCQKFFPWRQPKKEEMFFIIFHLALEVPPYSWPTHYPSTSTFLSVVQKGDGKIWWKINLENVCFLGGPDTDFTYYIHSCKF